MEQPLLITHTCTDYIEEPMEQPLLLTHTYNILPTTYYLPPTTYNLLPTTHYLLPTTYNILPTTYSSRIPTSYVFLNLYEYLYLKAARAAAEGSD